MRLYCVIALALLSCAASIPAGGADSGTEEQAQTRHRALIGLECVPECGNAPSWQIAEETHLNFATFWISWDGSTPYSYSWSSQPDRETFARHLAELNRRGFKIALVDTTVFMDQKHLPREVAGKRFSDPDLINLWTRHTEEILALCADKIDFFGIGAEVELYLGDKPDQWQDYQVFFKHGAEMIHRRFPRLKVGIIFASSSGDVSAYWKAVEPYCDYVGVNYYLPNSAFGKSPAANGLDPKSPKYFARALDGAVQMAGAKPVMITEVGCGTHPSIDSSPELQAEFVRQFFQWLRRNEDKIVAVQWFKAIDWNRETIRRQLRGQLGDIFLDHDLFMNWMASLGLMYENGDKKPGYDIFRNEVARYLSE
jgi:hypothetical protein